MQSISHNNLTWILIEDPKAEDISFIQGEFNLHPVIIGKLTVPVYRPQLTEHGDYLFAVFHYPIFIKSGNYKGV